MSKGQYITNANVDDRLAPICYEIHASELDANPDIMLVYSDRYFTRTPNQTFESHTGGKYPASPHFSKEIMYECWPCNNPMWRKQLHEMYGFFDSSFKHSGDWEMWLRAVEGGAKFKKIDGYYALYFYNPKGLSTCQDRKTQDIKEREDRYVRDRYGYLWGKETYREYYNTASSLDKTSNGEQRTWSLALLYYLKAFAINPHRAEPLIRIAQHYYTAHDNNLAYLFASRACDLPCPDDMDIEKEIYDFTRYDLLGILPGIWGNMTKVRKPSEVRLEHRPNENACRPI